MTIIKNRKAHIKIYLLHFIIITSILIITMITMSRSIKNYFYDLKKDEALKITRSISTHLSHTSEAIDTINGLLDDKLKDFLIMADSHRGYHSHEFFSELVNNHELDEVYSYNAEGIIEYSSSGNYIGWEANIGHPVYEFMIGDEDLLIEEDIRQDTESKVYYKYGYIKNPDGSFIQIGILAENIQELLDSFRLQNHLEDIMVDGDIVCLSTLDRDFRISASTNKEVIGSLINNEEIKTQISNGEIFEQINNSSGVDIYEIFVPLNHKNEDAIAFTILYSLNDIHPVIRNNTLISISAIIIVYISLMYSIIITYRRNKRLTYLAYYDNLTGLPNIESLKLKFNEDIIRNKNNQAILMVKCNDLNHMNLTFGYEYGDMVLKDLGHRLKTIEKNNIQLYKFTADKFVFYIEDYAKREELLSIVKEINGLINKPFEINDIRQHVAIKIGVKEFKDSRNLNKILKDATIALNYVDISEDNNYRIFNENMELNIQRAEIIERELRNAILKNDTSNIHLVYQPIINFKSNKIYGFEALARMNSQHFGSVSPLEFIEIAEKKQLIIPLSNLILKKACVFIAKVIESGFDNIRIAVNISTIHLLQDDFVSTVLSILDETGIDGRNLELEITETIFMDNFHLVNKKLKELREKGIHISLDDFGTGYSSFDRLSELNVDTLKIDQYFINKITDTNKDSMLTRDIISIAHRLGLKTIAEGVELDIQRDYLLEYDCDKFQGYLFSKPVIEEEAIKILNKLNI